MAERWLVIDDSSTIQRVIKLAFQGYDVVISEADSCQEAAREILIHPPSLVIADATLGGVQGVQDFMALKARAPAAPFIILEGSYDNIDEAQFRAAGFEHFLKKPFDGAQLLAITRQALGRALPYRGEAAMATAAGAVTAHVQPAMPPPPPPGRGGMRLATMENSGSGAESGQPRFDLGFQDRATPPVPGQRPPMTPTHAPSAVPALENRSMGQAIASEVRGMAQQQLTAELRSLRAEAAAGSGISYHPQVNPSVDGAGAPLRREVPGEPARRPVSFSLEDDAPPHLAPSAPLPGRSDSSAWEGPRPAGSQLGNILEPMLQEEMEKLVRIAVEDYCRKHFAGIARELIQRELDRLTQDRSRLLLD